MKLKFTLDEETEFEVSHEGGNNRYSTLVLEISPSRAMALWLDLERMLEAEGLIWEER